MKGFWKIFFFCKKSFILLCLFRSIYLYEKRSLSLKFNPKYRPRPACCREQLLVVSEQSWQAARAESAQPVSAVRRGMLVPHEGLQVRTTVSCYFFLSLEKLASSYLFQIEIVIEIIWLPKHGVLHPLQLTVVPAQMANVRNSFLLFPA